MEPINQVPPGIKSNPTINGIISNPGSRGGTPSPVQRLNPIPQSQLPPGFNSIPASQLPPTSQRSSITPTFTKQSVPQPLVPTPKYTSTPNQSLIGDLNNGQSAFSPISSIKTAQLPQQQANSFIPRTEPQVINNANGANLNVYKHEHTATQAFQTQPHFNEHNGSNNFNQATNNKPPNSQPTTNQVTNPSLQQHFMKNTQQIPLSGPQNVPPASRPQQNFTQNQVPSNVSLPTPSSTPGSWQQQNVPQNNSQPFSGAPPMPPSSRPPQNYAQTLPGPPSMPSVNRSPQNFGQSSQNQPPNSRAPQNFAPGPPSGIQSMPTPRPPPTLSQNPQPSQIPPSQPLPGPQMYTQPPLNVQMSNLGIGAQPVTQQQNYQQGSISGMPPRPSVNNMQPTQPINAYQNVKQPNGVLPQQQLANATNFKNRYPVPPVGGAQPGFNNQIPAFQQQQNQFANAGPGYPQPQQGGITQQGFSKMWNQEYIDLLQNPNILPGDPIEIPMVQLGSDVLNSANCSPEIFRSTITKVPENSSLLSKSRLPFGVLIHPFKDLTHLPVIQCNVIVRCRACRTYINPFVYFVDQKRWKCNLCYRVNELPEEFQYDPVSKTYGDPSRRPEIKSSTIEYIAPAEYMLRPPQPAVYLYLLDISRLAVECGYLDVVCQALVDEMDNLPGDARTQVGLILYDSNLHFYSLAEGQSQPHEMIVLDIEDVFLPCPDTLLVNLKDGHDLLCDILTQIPKRYQGTFDNNSCLGAALQAAHKIMSPTGGRVTVFQAALPNIGPGALTAREDVNQRTSGEVPHLNPANDFYKRLALECSGQQTAVDLFVVNSQYVDIATISGISRFSGGCIHHFPLFKASRVLQKSELDRCFRRYLTRKIGFEAVMRVRCTRGMSIHTFHGNFFVRSTDLLSLPNVNPDAGYGMQVSIEESLSDVQQVCFQAAVLYTSSKGERRIRVHTLCLPIASTLNDIIHSADQQCIVGLLSKMAVDRSLSSSLADAREAFINVAIDILASYKASLNMGSAPGSGLLAPNCLKLLPLYICALLKNTAFRTGASTRLDDRVKAMIDMKTKPLCSLIQNIYPDLYPVHNLEVNKVIVSAEEEQVHLAPRIQLSARCLDNTGAYLMDMGESMLLYVASNVSPAFLSDALGAPSYNALSDSVYEIPILDNRTNQRLHTFINYLNDDKPFAATLQIIKDNSPNRGGFFEKLAEDRFENSLSYHEFLQHVKAQIK